MSYKKLLQNHLEDFIKAQKINQPVVVTYSDFEDFQYQTPIALTLKKTIKDFNPEIIVDYLKNNHGDIYEEVKVTGPGFISVKFKLAEQTKELIKPKKVLVDYCGVNVAKQMHIGHIRSMFIGDFAVRLHEALGDEVVIHNHIGDWGNQFGFLLNYIIKNNLQTSLTNKNLTQYYKDAYLLNTNDPVFAEQSSIVATQLQNKSDNNLVALWEELVNISMQEAEKTFKELDLKVSLEHTQGESFYAPFCHNILIDLIDQKIATKNEDGSVVVFFNDKSPLVLQKSNGNFLYALYDLAAIKWRNDNVQPDKMIYVVDKRQALHFEQVFSVAKQAGFVKAHIDLLHLGFGTILGKDKKPLKTKEGESLYLDELFEQGKNILLQDKHFVDMPIDIKHEILNKTIVGGMKYYDLKFNKQQDYIFDWEHVLNFSGSSAPYIQNALVRIDSIFTKNNMNVENIHEIDWNAPWNQLEKEMIFRCQKTNELIESSENNYTSQAITEHAIKVCQLFHKYYESEKILGHTNEENKLKLIGKIYNTLQDICSTLGIQTYRCQQQMLKKKLVKKM